MIHFSVVIPQRNAAQEIIRLLPELCGELDALAKPYEVLCVDDGSEADQRQALQGLLEQYDCLRVLSLDRSAGISAALCAGMAAARGEIVIALEASRQYPVSEISRLTQRLNRVDAVFGCRRAGKVARLVRRLLQWPRWVLLGVEARDPDCLLWAARQEALEGIHLARGMHRYLPMLVSRRGFRVGELHVDHRSQAQRPSWTEARRRPGDLLTAWFLRRRARPFAVRELSVREEQDPRITRIDPPQPLDRRGPAAPDAPRGDRRNKAS